MDTNLIILIGNSVLVVGAIGWLIWQELRLRRFLRGASGASLEEKIVTAIAAGEQITTHHHELRQHHNQLLHRYESCLKGVGMVRFNPFSDTGSDQSFALAFVNSYGDGTIISSLHGRESTRIFAKPITGFTCQYKLNLEEQSALDQARENM